MVAKDRMGDQLKEGKNRGGEVAIRGGGGEEEEENNVE